MNKHSTIITTDYSSPETKARDSPSHNEDKQSDLNSTSIKQSKQKQHCEIQKPGYCQRGTLRKQRRHSFIQLEEDTQIKMEKMIRDQVQMQRKVDRKFSLDIDQTCLCTSDIYTKDHVHWRNRQISQLTTKKLDSILIGSIKKIKVLNEQPMVGYNLFKVTTGQKQMKDFAIRTMDIPLWFSNSIWMCLVSSGFQTTNKIVRDFQGQMQGQILKKSQFLGNWQLRYITISAKNGLSSSKKKDSPASVRIKQTAQMWTRLEVIPYENVNYVIIKFWYMMFKYQFGIPVSDCVRWLKAFSTLIK